MGPTHFLDHRDVHVSASIHLYTDIMLMYRLWIPLKPLEEETDPEKAQKLSEMIAILREVSPSHCICGTCADK